MARVSCRPWPEPALHADPQVVLDPGKIEQHGQGDDSDQMPPGTLAPAAPSLQGHPLRQRPGSQQIQTCRGHGKLAQLRIAHQALRSQSRREQHITAHQPEQKQRTRLSALHIPASQQGKPEQHHASRRNQGKVQICRLAQFRFSAQETVNSTSSILRREVFLQRSLSLWHKHIAIRSFS
jgi:hypothetical protein